MEEQTQERDAEYWQTMRGENLEHEITRAQAWRELSTPSGRGIMDPHGGLKGVVIWCAIYILFSGSIFMLASLLM
jgi:hypothetical protein